MAASDNGVSPLKVSRETHARVRSGAAMMGVPMSRFVDMAVAAFLDNHREELEKALKEAADVLLGGNRD